MNIPILLISAVLAGTAAPEAAQPQARADQPEIPALSTIIEQGIRDQVFPGAVLVVGNRTERVHAGAYGHFGYDATTPAMRLDTIFDLASVSKVAGTATAAMVLLEDGTLRLQDPVSRYLPDFGRNGKEDVTVLDLLTHTSGLKAYENRNRVEETRADGESPADALIRTYCELPADYEPRSRIRYSCLNMQTMARVNEVASGQKQEDLLKERVYGPLGMPDTGYVLSEEQVRRAAPTLELADGSWLQGVVHDPLANYHGSVDHSPGNAGLFSSAPDLAAWCEMILGEGQRHGIRVFKPSTVFRMTANLAPVAADNRRGLGWDIYESDEYTTGFNTGNGSRAIGHTGYTGTFLWLDQHSGTYVVLLTNRTFPNENWPEGSRPTIYSVQRKVVAEVISALELERPVLVKYPAPPESGGSGQ